MDAGLSAPQAIAFVLAAWAVIGNDALQTLGPFLAANRGRTPRPLQGLYLAGVLCLVLLLGWWSHGGDGSWGRLECFPLPPRLGWSALLAPLTVLLLTQLGVPVSTSFLVLTAMGPANLPALLRQSLLGYGAALLLAFCSYGAQIAWRRLQPEMMPAPAAPPGAGSAAGALASSGAGGRDGLALALQWAASGWLWSQWLIQDLANIYVYLPRRLEPALMALSLLVLCGGIALLLVERGGAIQAILQRKRDLDNPRATTALSLLYGLVLAGFAALSRLPLSTTWVFLGLLAGRELALQLGERRRSLPMLAGDLGRDLALAALGLAVSLAVALTLPSLPGGG